MTRTEAGGYFNNPEDWINQGADSKVAQKRVQVLYVSKVELIERS